MGEAMRVVNETRGTVLVSNGRVASNSLTRLRGLIGSKPLESGQGLLIVGCKSVHTHFMGFAIDVLYMDRDKRVAGMDRDLTPWRLGHTFAGSRHVIELPAGTLEASGTQAGDALSIEGYALR